MRIDKMRATLATFGYTGSINDAYRNYLLSEAGLTAASHFSVNDLEKKVLAGFGYSGSINDMWMAFLSAAGYTGALDDRLNKFWEDGAGFTPFWAPLTHSLLLSRGNGTATYTGATAKTFQDWEGVLRTAIAGEARFVGARRVRNLVPGSSEDFSNAAFSDSGTPTVTTSIVDVPTGAITSTQIVADAVNEGRNAAGIFTIGRTYIASIVAKGAVGGEQFYFTTNTGDGGTATATTEWATYTKVFTATGANLLVLLTAASTVKFSKWMVEDITGRTDQTTPSEYVSVGATDLVGAELVTNGGGPFTATTDWSPSYGATLTIESGLLVVTDDGVDGAQARAVTPITTVIGKAYVASTEVADLSTAAILSVTNNGDGSGPYAFVSSTSAGPATVYFTATATTTYLTFITGGATAGDYAKFSSITCGENLYHGAGVDGVAYYDTDLSGNPLPTSYTYDAVSLNGVAGTYVSTPNATANQITGDLQIIAKIQATSYAAADQVILARDGAGPAYFVHLSRTATLSKSLTFIVWQSTVAKVATSSAALTTADGSVIWVKITLSVSTGKVNFYTSTDGVTYSILGAEQSITAAATDAGTANLAIGSSNGGGSGNFGGKIYQAQIYNGIDGTLAVDFDASRYAGGTTLTGSTGETWTLQGSAVIHPTNYPNLGYLAEAAATNLCLQSNAFTTTWTAAGTPAATQNVVGPDGATSAWTLTDNDGAGAEAVYQQITLTAAAYTFSIFVQKTTGAQASYPVVATYAAGSSTEMALCTIDTSNGVATDWTAYTGFTMAAGRSVRTTSYNDDFWRVELTKTGTAEPHRFDIYPAATTNATQSTGTLDAAAQGSAAFYGAQVELGSAATSYIPTTTVAVTRNADVLTYPSAGNISGTVGSAYAEIGTLWSSPGGQRNALGFSASIDGLINHSGSIATGLRAYDNTNSVEQASNPTMFNSQVKYATAWGGSSMKITGNGSAVTSGSFDGSIGGAIIAVGCSGGSVSQWGGPIRNVRIFGRALSSSELQAITR